MEWEESEFLASFPDIIAATIVASIGVKGVAFVKIPVVGMAKGTIAGTSKWTLDYKSENNGS